MNSSWLEALWGGVLIGVAVSMMLLGNGRVTGISGIVFGLLRPQRSEVSWRFYFLGGLLGGGLTVSLLKGPSFASVLSTPFWTVPLAGLLVGFGTVLGSGCTSGHGVCGISRLSPRSLVATVLFMISGILTVYLIRQWGVLS